VHCTAPHPGPWVPEDKANGKWGARKEKGEISGKFSRERETFSGSRYLCFGDGNRDKWKLNGDREAWRGLAGNAAPEMKAHLQDSKVC